MKAQEQRLVSGGQFNFGRYDAPFASVNPLDAQPFSMRVPRGVRNFRLKEWLAFQVANERFFANIALFNAKLMALVQVKLYDRKLGKKHLFEKRVPAWSLRAPEQLLDSTMEYKSKRESVRFVNQLKDDRIDIEFELPATKKSDALVGKLSADFRGQTPLVVAIPFADNRGMYSQKGMVPVEGFIAAGEERSEFTKQSSYLLMDDHRGYYPWEMQWDWLTSGRVDEHGKLFGFNLTDNDSIDPATYNENAFWYDGTRHDLGPVSFERVHEEGGELWRVRDREGRVHVDFAVEVPGHIDMNVGVIKSKYRGPFGTCSGFVQSESSQKFSVDGMFGMGEDFYLRI